LLFDGEPDALARFAQNRVWELVTKPGVSLELAPDVIRAEETPSQEGDVIHRVLAAERPLDAQPVPATLEDGYMWLINVSAGAA
jgi:hypothetical protein